MAGEIAGSLLLAAVVTKLVDLIRKVDPNDRFWKGTWIVLAMILGLVLALVFEISVLAELGLEPENELQGIIGQILTGLVVGATSSSYHELWDAPLQPGQAEPSQGRRRAADHRGPANGMGRHHPQGGRDGEQTS